jgi:hypothetical protein
MEIQNIYIYTKCRRLESVMSLVCGERRVEHSADILALGEERHLRSGIEAVPCCTQG